MRGGVIDDDGAIQFYRFLIAPDLFEDADLPTIGAQYPHMRWQVLKQGLELVGIVVEPGHFLADLFAIGRDPIVEAGRQ